MKMVTGERVLMESDSKELVLTTHRLRIHAQKWGAARVTSIMLEELCSCELSYKSFVILLLLAALGLVGLGGTVSPIAGTVVALGCVAAYYLTRRQALVFASPTARIVVVTQGMSIERALEFVDAVEGAKVARRRPVLGACSPKFPASPGVRRAAAASRWIDFLA